MANHSNNLRTFGSVGFVLLILFAFGFARSLTQEECAALQKGLAASGNSIPGACGRVFDTKILSGGCANPSEAKEFLKDRTSNKQSIDGLNPEFACNLMKFMKAAPGTITISVGVYKVTASVATMGRDYCLHFQCIEGTNSHPRGLAADLLYNGDDTKPSGPGSPERCRRNPLCVWAHENAASFSLQYRLMPGSPCFPGKAEAWHIELKGTGCDGDAGGGLASGAGQVGGIASAVRGLFEKDPQPQTAAPGPVPTQAVALSQSPISSFQQPPNATVPITSDDTGGAVVPDVSSLLTQSNTDDTSGTNPADALEALAFGTGANTNTSVTTNHASVPVVVSGTSTTVITDVQNQGETSAPQTTGISAASQQTFTSGDLSWQTGSSAGVPQTRVQQILSAMKAALLRMLPYLQPFGGREMPEGID